MIYIFEDKPQKLSGLRSLYISFDYDREILNIVKSSGTYFFHINNCLWEVPITSLTYLLDNLCYMDDIDLIVEDNAETDNLRHGKLTYKTTPYQYQKEGVEYFLNHNKGLLLDAPGLGKTLQMICLGEELNFQENIEHVLIICGIASLRTNWMKEIAKHSYKNAMMVGARINRNNNLVWDSIQKRVEQLMNPIEEFFVIINVESIRDDYIVNAIKKGPNKYGLIVLDEAHKCKGWGTHQGSNLLELQAEHQVAMTGTLLLNKPTDAYVPLAWIGVEPKKSVTKFKNTFCIFDDKIKGRIIGYKNLDILKDEISSCSLRRTKDLLDLPPKTIIEEELVMDSAQDKFYKEIKESVKAEVKQLAINDCDKVKLNTSNYLALIIRLQQASTCPSVLTTQNIPSCKIDRACDLVEEIVSNGNKVVIITNFKETVYQVKEALKEYKPLIGTGDIKDSEFSKNVDMFQEDDEHKVFIGTISKMGTGFTLTRATYMIFIDLPWTDGIYQQAQDRIHRIGSDSPVFIYSLHCRDTVDELTVEACSTKKALSEYVVDDIQDVILMSKLQKYLLDLK